ncbi:mannose-6-phosphate isomerase ManA [Clostridium homopropionicum DSM 5847]|uniref:Phosphohexomutase n=1 Tax=Clostridium homopropionicum DSM 5847 TaxID=1121318 RepID=A0A0L6ZFA2_9CLOT|nr:type I phosphomannose isomerase catalytic subunit [Clostridium homopropionicum]KOA21463.1 mannose-6-phosphate isomerase ManA [Clostridium homopropionicum DSM 5847]SFG08923.1 mannose-6-phosphate isomerase, type 1 [Clostridium homopropionicum]
MYPLKFENIYFQKVWGGRKFEKIRDNLPEGNIGESWDISCHVNGKSKICNGIYKGETLENLISLKGEKILGTKMIKGAFPLLIKLIDAEDKLSIQVHPKNQDVKVEGESGKTELWYVMYAEKEAKIILGFKSGVEKKEIKEAIEKGQLEKLINEIPVSTGQVFYVRSGLIHAIGEGIIIAEIQQNSDTTFRIYDYNRGRELNTGRALEVLDVKLEGKESKGIKTLKDGYEKTYLCLCNEFSVELYEVKTCFKEYSDMERFYIFTCVQGNGKINYIIENNLTESMNIKLGDSIFIPAYLGEYSFQGNMKLLKSYVPDVEKVRKEILNHVET